MVDCLREMSICKLSKRNVPYGKLSKRNVLYGKLSKRNVPYGRLSKRNVPYGKLSKRNTLVDLKFIFQCYMVLILSENGSCYRLLRSRKYVFAHKFKKHANKQ